MNIIKLPVFINTNIPLHNMFFLSSNWPFVSQVKERGKGRKPQKWSMTLSYFKFPSREERLSHVGNA